ncbi:transposase InsO family protein [Nocardia fluminea]|uniref:Transposase InsO family protein n=2 Tax=Nocardia fluminea TaxID=134984 RepID=A0A2N3VDF0_9NOCA|nr:transposase InsO family protein [Nocardia fluminea]
MDRQTMVEYRYRAVCEVLGGSPIGEVAARYGTTRQSVDTWRRRFKQEGMAGLADRSRRPHTSPTRIGTEIEALICQVRRDHPRWGARRISYELSRRGIDNAPSRATVHRALTRNGLVDPQAQHHKRKYKRWQRQVPMHLWQLDIVGGVPLADGRQCKLLTGIDDHSRFVVVAAVLITPSAREVAAAFTAAMRRYGVPSEVLTDNGAQFTGRYFKPAPVEVLFERICRTNGIKQRLTKPRSPTTTGKIERFHKTLRTEFLDLATPFESHTAAQQAVEGWITSYNTNRPHQALDMATPAELFRPNGPTRLDVRPATTATTPSQSPTEPVMVTDVISPPEHRRIDGAAVEFEARVPPSGELNVLHGRQRVSMHLSMVGRTLTVWADQRSVHLVLDGHPVRTVASRLRPEDLRHLAMRGARPAGPEPAKPALRRGPQGAVVIAPGQTVEIRRVVSNDGMASIAGQRFPVGAACTGRNIILRLDGHLMHAVLDNALVGTWPCPVARDGLSRLRGAELPTTPLPPPPLPAGSLRALRKVHTNGRVTIAGEGVQVGRGHSGKIVTVVVEDTFFRILHGDEEIAVAPRRSLAPITRFHVTGGGARPQTESSVS